MPNRIVIAIDAMGGDKAPEIVIEGMSLALNKYSDIYYKVFGDKEKITPLIESFSNLNNKYDIIHTESYIKGEDKPADALRKGRDSSMRLAVNSVKDGTSDAIVSAGNTGALMAISKFVLGTINGIDRPAITTCIPTKKNTPCTILDLGANSECSKEQLLQFAIMGDAFSKAVAGIAEPRVALLNIGEETLKGNELVKSAAEMMQNHDNINYVGFVEGDSLFSGEVDVVVTDGFTGNVALKVLEGTVKFLSYKAKSIFNSFFSKIGLFFLVLFSYSNIKKTYKTINPSNYNGAMLIGLEGISVKSHGSADKKSFASAIIVAVKLVKGKVNDKIKDELKSSAITQNTL